MKILDPSIILVRPQMPENIGLVARAMQNCGLKKLILVSPREKWPNQKALDVSANANTIIQKTEVFNSIKLALAPFHYVIATSARKRFLQKFHLSDFSLLFKQIPYKKNIAIVFGPENSGLSNEDLLLCDSIFSIDLSTKNMILLGSRLIFTVPEKSANNLHNSPIVFLGIITPGISEIFSSVLKSILASLCPSVATIHKHSVLFTFLL